jgi:uncharacterized membrane protein YccC
MPTTGKPYRKGQWIVIGVALGAFIGMLFGKLALGMISGFFVGLIVDSGKRKATTPADRMPDGDGDSA